MTKYRRFITTLVASTLVALTQGRAQGQVDAELESLKQEIRRGEVEASPQEAEALLTLIQLMETDIATKTALLDMDDAPGVVTVLRGEDLSARGVRTVSDALTLVPGLDITIDNLGVADPIVRGVGGILTGVSGKLKVMLNGIDMNSTLTGTAESVYRIAIEQVDRIEIIRGPGSAIYGEYAYAGVINVVTRGDGKRVFARYGSFDTVTGGGLYSYVSPRGLRLSVNVGGWITAGDDIQTGKDILYGPLNQGPISNAPGLSNEKGKNATAVMALDYRGLSLNLQYTDNGSGDHFGVENALSSGSNDTPVKNTWWQGQLKYTWDIMPSLHAEAKGGWKKWILEFDNLEIFPPGFLGVYPAGQIASTHYEEKRGYGGLELTWKGLEKHTVLLGMEHSRTTMGDARSKLNFFAGSTIPGTSLPIPLPGFQSFPGVGLERDKSRYINSAFIQDQFTVSDRFVITGGVRYDHYSDAGNSLNPRLAAVYEISDRHILKAQYGRAFRPPTFTELYSITPTALGNPNIDPETIDTVELNYIYKTPTTVLRGTAYHSDLKDFIVLSDRRFSNSGGARLNGVDLEWEQQWGEKLKLDANLSYLDTEDEDTGRELEGAANWMGNIGLIYQPRPDYSLNLQYRYVGKRHRAPVDPRDRLDSYHTLDFTASAFNLGTPGLTLRGGVKNVFDNDVVHPARPFTYPEDYPRAGRSFWLQVSKDF